MAFQSFELTNDGINLLAQVQAELGSLNFTKVKIGSGTYTGDIKLLTGIITEFYNFPVTSTQVQTDKSVKIQAPFNNTTFTQAYSWREIGIYAKLGETGTEILYSYSSDSTPDTIPNYDGGLNKYRRTLDIRNYISDVTSVTLEIVELTNKYDFNTVAEMVAATYLVDGDRVQLWGYEELGDSEFIEGYVSTTEKENSIPISNSLFFELKNYKTEYKVTKIEDIIKANKKINSELVIKGEDEIDLDFKLPVNRNDFAFNGDYNNYKSLYAENLHNAKLGDTKGKYLTGKTNFGDINNIKHLVGKEKINIVILGDSISTGEDYSKNGFTNGYLPRDKGGANNKSYMSKWSSIFAKEMFANSKDIDFDIYNRSIGGCSYQQLQDNFGTTSFYTQTDRQNVDESKTWYENVMLCDPDVLILSMGMNHNDENHYKYFIENFYSYFKNEQKFIDGKIQVVVMTTPQPKYGRHSEDGVNFIDFTTWDKTASKTIIQQQQRSIARDLGGYCIDVAKLSSIFRFGYDPLNYSIGNKDILIDTLNETNGIIYTKSYWHANFNGVLKCNTKRPFHSCFVGLDAKFDANFLATAGNTMVIDFGDVRGKTLFQISSVGTGNKINVGIYNTVESSKNKVVQIVVDPAKVYGIDLTLLQESIHIWFDQEIIFQYENPIYYRPMLRIVGTGAIQFSIKRMYEQQMFTTKQNMIDREMYAINDIEAEYGQANEDGYGGGINHPSTLGVLVYSYPVKEFVNDLISKYNDLMSFKFNTISNSQDVFELGDVQIITSTIEANIVDTAEVFDITFNKEFEGIPVITTSSGINATSNPLEGDAKDYVNVMSATTTGVRIILIKRDDATVGKTTQRKISFSAIGKKKF